MLFRYLLALAIHLCWASLGLADQDQTITIPWVTDAPDYFQGYGGQALGATGGTTTYGINCLASHPACRRFTPDMTLIYGPSTYDMVAKGYKFDFTSGCTLIGAPTPTMATCTETKSFHQKHAVDTATVLVPATGTQSSLGIFPATLIVTDAGDFAATSTVPQTEPSVNSDVSTSDGSSTPIETGTPINPTSELMVAYVNTTITPTDLPVPFDNRTSPDHKNGSTVTVTVLASPIPCRCECNCNETLPARPLDTSPKEKSHAVKMALPMALLGGLVAGSFFWNCD
ncbi:hypothetical protein N7457_004632 [Penicillium paradoxum]|uniref:uncharacterized protein n=1 Tax=Penicillium paradoxum TaxID=176176 RepID=UPI002548E09B|nr:uncharacterized protein N7457_004632 [Penicillium paradoxum]KAJ5782858.1 hypothetical protein N7457_004632 [Penicillium paradoxum]